MIDLQTLTGKNLILFGDTFYNLDDILAIPLSSPSVEVILFSNTIDPIIRLMACIIRKKSFIVLDQKWPDSFRNDYIVLLEQIKECPPEMFYILTSGTSGEPKLCCHFISSLFLAAERSLSNLNLTDDDFFLLSIPISSMGGLMTLVKSLVSQSTLVIPDRHWKYCLSLPYSMHLTLVPQQLPTFFESFSNSMQIKSILIGGDALPPNRIAELCSLGIPFSLSYGLTETCGQVIATPFSLAPNETFELLPGVGLKCSKDGCLMINSMTLPYAYLMETGLKLVDTENGFFITNDIVELSPFKFIGRVDFQFQNGSKLVSPELIEKTILTSGLIQHILIIPKQDDRMGFVPFAFVDSLDHSDKLKDYCQSHLPIYLRPVGFDLLPTEFTFFSPNLRKKLLLFL